MAIGSVEASLPWGGDFSLTSTGDLALAQDTPQSTAATTQRLIRLVLTCPIVKDGSGNAIMPPDDVFHPTWGAGLPAQVGETVDNSILASMQASISQALLSDPMVAKSPPPQVTATLQPDFKTVIVNITVWTNAGQVLALPPIPVTSSGA